MNSYNFRDFCWLLVIGAVIAVAACGSKGDDTKSSADDSRDNPESTSSTTQIPSRVIYEGDNVFGFVDSRTDGPRINTATKAWELAPGEPREVVVWDETFQVAAGNEVTIDSKIVKVIPTSAAGVESVLNIFGRLTITNSILLWYSPIHRAPRLVIKNGGKLTIKDSYSFQGNASWVNWEFESGSQVSFDNFVGDSWTSIHGGVNYESKNFSTVKLTFLASTSGTSVSITNSHHIWFEVFPPKPSTIDISFPKRQQWNNWSLNNIWPSTVVNVIDSYIYERDISLSIGVRATVRDTDGFSLGWILGNDSPTATLATCSLDGLGDPSDNVHGKFYADQTWDLVACGLDSSLRVVNSTVVRAWPTIWGKVDLTVRRSNLADTRVLGGGARYRIYDSLVGILEASGYYDTTAESKPKAYVESSIISADLDAKYGAQIWTYNVSPVAGGTFRKLEMGGGTIVELVSAGSPF